MLGSYGLGKEHESNYLGHVAVTTLKLACANVFIVKQRPIPYPPVGKPAAWVLATDNSPCARHAFDVVLSLVSPASLPPTHTHSVFGDITSFVSLLHRARDVIVWIVQMGVGDQLYIFYSAKYESFSKQVKTYHEKQLDMIGRKVRQNNTRLSIAASILLDDAITLWRVAYRLRPPPESPPSHRLTH